MFRGYGKKPVALSGLTGLMPVFLPHRKQWTSTAIKWLFPNDVLIWFKWGGQDSVLYTLHRVLTLNNLHASIEFPYSPNNI